jgi:hypothetical protein
MQRQQESQASSQGVRQAESEREQVVRAIREETLRTILRIEAIDQRLQESGVAVAEISALRSYREGLLDGLFSFVMRCNPRMTYNAAKGLWETYVEQRDVILSNQ